MGNPTDIEVQRASEWLIGTGGFTTKTYSPNGDASWYAWRGSCFCVSAISLGHAIVGLAETLGWSASAEDIALLKSQRDNAIDAMNGSAEAMATMREDLRLARVDIASKDQTIDLHANRLNELGEALAEKSRRINTLRAALLDTVGATGGVCAYDVSDWLLTEVPNEVKALKRNLERDLAAESKRCGELATELDAARARVAELESTPAHEAATRMAKCVLPDISPGQWGPIAGTVCHHIDWLKNELAAETKRLERADAELEALRSRPVGAAEWLDGHCGADGWSVRCTYDDPVGCPVGWVACAYRPTRMASGRAETNRIAREALARSLGWPGAVTQPPQPAPVATLGGSLGTHDASTRQGATSGDIAGVVPDRGVCESFGADGRGIGFNVYGLRINGDIDHVWFASDEPLLAGKWYRKANVAAAVIPASQVANGARVVVAVNKPDDCPLPKVGEWEWCDSGTQIDGEMRAEHDRVALVVEPPTRCFQYWDWDASESDCLVAKGITRTRKGAMRAAERAARRAWQVRNGGKA